MSTTGFARMSAALAFCALASAGCGSGESLSEPEFAEDAPTAVDPVPSTPVSTVSKPSATHTSAPITPIVTSALVMKAIPSPTPDALTLLDMEPEELLEVRQHLVVPRTAFSVSIAFSAISPAFFHSGIGQRIQEVDLANGEVLREFPTEVADYTELISVSPSGEFLASNEGPEIQVHDLRNGQVVASLPLSGLSTVSHLGFLEGGLVFGADYAGNAALWDSATWEEVARIQDPGKKEAALVASGGSVVVMQAHKGKLAKLFNLDGELIAEVPLQGENLRVLSISPAGDRLLVYANRGFASEGISIVAVPSGDAEHTIPHLNSSAFAVSPDWTLLAAIDSAGTLRLFELPAGDPIFSQELGLFKVRSLSISPNNRYLAIHSLSTEKPEGLIQIWARAEARQP